MSPSQDPNQGNAPIFLVGFMGSGKTTVGQALANHLHYAFFDLDQLIEARVGRSVAQIFAELGESEFRRLEREGIVGCHDLQRAVIALGGGAYVSEENRNAVRVIGKSFWLDCPLEVCLQRISGDQSRPLLGDEAQMKELFDQRRPAYEKADYIVQAAVFSPDELAAEIAEIIRSPLSE